MGKPHGRARLAPTHSWSIACNFLQNNRLRPMSGGACLHGLRGLGRCLRTNADFKGYRAGVAARVWGSVRLDKGLGNIWGVTVFRRSRPGHRLPTQYRILDSIRCCHMGCAVHRGGYGHGGGNVWRTAVDAVAVCIILVVQCVIGRIAEPALAGGIRFRVVNRFGIRLP